MGNEILSSFCCLHVVHPSFSYGYVRQVAVIADNLHKKKSRAAPTVRPVLRPRSCKINLMSKYSNLLNLSLRNFCSPLPLYSSENVIYDIIQRL